jgi:hypothetical protein
MKAFLLFILLLQSILIAAPISAQTAEGRQFDDQLVYADTNLLAALEASGFTSTEQLAAARLKYQQLLQRISGLKESRQLNWRLVWRIQREVAKFQVSYTQWPTLSETLNEGQFNCLTVSVLYALLFEDLGIPYKLIETNYHTFILVQTQKRQLLIEPTDPEGFYSNRANIGYMLERYRNDNAVASASGEFHQQRGLQLFDEVSLQQAIGLLHYNRAVEYLINGTASQALQQTKLALERYPSARIEAFKELLVQGR